MTGRADHYRAAEEVLDKAEAGLALTVDRIRTAGLPPAEQLHLEVALASAIFQAVQAHAAFASVPTEVAASAQRTATPL